MLLYEIYQLPFIPIKLVVFVVVFGLGSACAVLKGLFSRQVCGGFGITKTQGECPRLYQALSEVASRVNTEPVDQVVLAPGATICVHQEGRGPFGVFGVKRRVLSLGLSTLHFLTVAELQSILAHEYAHFSYRDTVYGRFIYQVSLSIQQALRGMGQLGGQLNYINPFFWFLVLYQRAYALLSAGFFRSREFLADRMAATLYGSDTFAAALSKVSIEGALFERITYENIVRLVEQNKCLLNMYSAFREFREKQLSEKERDELSQKLLDEKESAFATHPTFRERVEAVAALPQADSPDTRCSLELFEQPEQIEKELTEFLTAHVGRVRQVQLSSVQRTTPPKSLEPGPQSRLMGRALLGGLLSGAVLGGLGGALWGGSVYALAFALLGSLAGFIGGLILGLGVAAISKLRALIKR